MEVVPFGFWTETQTGIWVQEQIIDGNLARLTYGRYGDIERFAVTTRCPNQKERATTVVWERGDLFGTSISCDGKFVEHNAMRLERLFTNLPTTGVPKPPVGFVNDTFKQRLTV